MKFNRLLYRGYRAHKRRKHWQHFVQTLAAIVVFCCTYALILPATTMEADPICGIAAHTHEEGCFGADSILNCLLEEHVHDCGCYPMPTTPPEETPDTQPEDLMAVPSDPAPSDPQPSAPAESQQYYSDDDGTQTQVDLPADTDVPQDAALTVTPITEEDEQYVDMAQQILDAVPDGVAQMTLLDISFYDASGEYLSVSDTALVDILFPEDVFSSGQVKVFHFVDGTAVELETVSVDRYAVSEEDGTETIQTQLAFETEGFSVFAVVAVLDTYDRITLTDPAELAGNSYYIVSNNQNYIMLDSMHSNNNGLGWTSYTGTDSLAGNPTWKFVDAGDGTYYILSSNGNYMVMEDSTSSTAKVSLTTSIDAATKFTVRAINGQAEIGYDGPDGIAHYLNVYYGDQDFLGWQDSGLRDDGSKVYLHIAEDNSGTHDLVTNLGGQTFAIVSNAATKAMLTDSTTVNSVPGLQTQTVTIATVDSVRYVTGDVPQWTFEATATAGVYNIYTEIDGDKQYLTLLAQHYQATSPDGRGSLSLSSTPQDISVIANDDGTVYLSATVDGCTGYINLDQSGSGSFWTYKQEDASDKLLLCKEVTGFGLFYDLNAPSGASWINTPSISQVSQIVTTDGIDLPSVAGANAVGSFVDNTIASRSAVRTFYNNYNTALGDSLTADNYLAPGAEYRFLGWQATVDGNTYLFPENATAVLGDDGYIHITDVDGVERALPPNTTLTGQWKMVSDVVLFFVNFGDTILDTEDGQEIAGYGSNYYTGIVAIGHIYDPSTVSPGRNADNTKDTILKANNDKIQAEIVPQYDPSVTDTQIVIDAVAQLNSAGTGFEFVASPNMNQNQLEVSVGEYLQNDPNSSTQIKIDNAYVDRSEITAENYKLHWYLQKEVGDDGWHIDGVLVATTYSIEIYKTFSGLTNEQATAAIDSMTFPLSLIHELATGTDEKDDYTTLTASGSQDGVYINNGQQGSSNIYKWTLNAIKGQRYAFEETGYEVTGYTCSSLISVHYTDGTVLYHYNTATTFDTSDLFAEKPLVGGQVESVIFANFYTKTGTGAFSVSKVQEGNETNRLSGAVFTLTNSSGTTTSVTTNENGAAHFGDLPVGTYTLKETTEPSGYQSAASRTWKVQVTAADGNVTVEVWEVDSNGTEITDTRKTCYDLASGGIQEVYLIENTPEHTTLTLSKYFSGISTEDLAALYANSKATGTNPYYIELQKKQTDGTYSTFKTIYLSEAQEMVGVVGYQWSITGVDAGEYRIVEKNFRHANYADTVVSATFNGAAAAITKDSAQETASFTVTMTDHADTLEITNTYTNTFQLKLKKVDSTTKDALSGAVFKIYSLDHTEATSGETYEYTDSNGNKQIAYYVGQTTASGSDGIAVFDGLKLSSGSKTYVYVFEEFATPNGYIKLDTPVISSVTVGATDGYTNGVLTLEVANTSKNDATLSVTADAVWNVPWTEDTYPELTLTLYRQAGDTAELVETTVLTQNTGWEVVWSDLPYTNDDGTEYTYYVSQTPLPGYTTDYSNAVSTLTVNGQQVSASVTLGSDLDRSVTVTNSTSYELPEAGGIGTGWFTLVGLLTMLAAALLTIRSRRTAQ